VLRDEKSFILTLLLAVIALFTLYCCNKKDPEEYLLQTGEYVYGDSCYPYGPYT